MPFPFRIALFWALLVTALPALSAAEYSFSPPPAWVSPIGEADAPAKTEQQALTTLLTDDQIHVGAPFATYRRRVYTPQTTAGVEEISELKLHFNPAFEKLAIHRILVRRGAEVRDLTRKANIRVVAREEQLGEGIHDGTATALVILDDIRTGDIVDYSYTVTGSNPIFGDRQFGFVGLNGKYGIERLHVRLLTSDQHPLHIKAFNQPGLDLAPRPANGGQEYVIELTHVPVPAFEDNTPVSYSPYSWLEFSEYGSWNDVDQWAGQLYSAEAVKTGPLFDALYARLNASAKSPEEFIPKALFAVQNDVRYLGLEFGENSHRPRPPEEVLKTRYGDCKDKALLLSKLLQRRGINAWPALVSTRFQKGIADELASPGVFDHVITLVRLDGKNYWLDSTRRFQTGKLQDIGWQDFGYALVIGDPNPTLMKMYDTLPVVNTMNVEEHYFAEDFSGPIRLQSVTTFEGNAAEAQREYFSNRPIMEIRKAWADFASQYHDDLRVLKPLEYEDDPEHNRFVIREFYQLDSFWQKYDEGNIPKISAPFVLASYADVLRAPNTVERKAPVALPTPRVVSTRIYLHLPSNLNLKLNTPPIVMDEKAFRFSSQDRYYDRTYYNHSELLIKTPEVAATDFPAFQKAVREARKQMEFSISFMQPEKSGYAEIQEVRKRVRGEHR
ncbi:uncharacterized protein DUF3857 [Fluviicoccus keumensis]|uniref:Uncharacterized protein DUF3857 n=1 Tax=Fluviicoccus keumensis TaxID=1435465 RepID=A0A4Q7YJG9_9GAMM|nr:DUF3857 domain-containing protein [Fluviicoccus keumensis]RZU36923.1 uncharacterized protein DUF3857 [Fluviicoccus keumensis]